MNESTHEKAAVKVDSAASDAVSDAELEARLNEFNRLSAQKYSSHRRHRRSTMWACGYGAAFVTLIRMADLSIPHRLFFLLFCLYKLALLQYLFNMIGGRWFAWMLAKRSRDRAAILLEQFREEPHAVGAIAQFCFSPLATRNGTTCRSILLKLLPRVNAADARYISDNQMEALLKLIGAEHSSRYEDLPFAILKALEQIGDSRAIAPVRRLTTGRRNRDYHEAARECLAVLEQHGAQQDDLRTLLIPASATSPETLLRATTYSDTTPPEQLLRAGLGETQR